MALILEVLLIQGASKEEGGLCDLRMLSTPDEIANIKILIASVASILPKCFNL